MRDSSTEIGLTSSLLNPNIKPEPLPAASHGWRPACAGVLSKVYPAETPLRILTSVPEIGNSAKTSCYKNNIYSGLGALVIKERAHPRATKPDYTE